MPRHPRRLAPLVASLVLASALGACGGGNEIVGRVRVPIAYNPAGPAQAEQCIAVCRARTEPDVAAYASCLTGCPGAEIDKGERCESTDRAPRAVCVQTLMARREPPPPSSSPASSEGGGEGGGWLGDVIAGVVGGAIEAAASGATKSRSSSTSTSSQESSDGQASGQAARVASAPSHAPASPSKNHAPASPSKGSSSEHAPASPSKGSSSGSKKDKPRVE